MGKLLKISWLVGLELRVPIPKTGEKYILFLHVLSAHLFWKIEKY
jgi:hypothetical protein